VIGYVGRAEIDEQPIDEWLYDFIGRNLEGELRDLAYELKSKLEHDLGSDAADDAMLLHLAGFVEDAGEWKPQIWFIRNAHGMDALGYTNIDDQFDVSDEIPGYFPALTGTRSARRLTNSPMRGSRFGSIRDTTWERSTRWTPYSKLGCAPLLSNTRGSRILTPTHSKSAANT
jgi:hypothetical protein